MWDMSYPAAKIRGTTIVLDDTSRQCSYTIVERRLSLAIACKISAGTSSVGITRT